VQLIEIVACIEIHMATLFFDGSNHHINLADKFGRVHEAGGFVDPIWC